MVAEIINGNEIAKSIRAEIKAEVAKMKAKGVEPGLVVIIVGEDPASRYMSGRRGRRATT